MRNPGFLLFIRLRFIFFRKHLQRPHHIVILMFQQMAMPNIPPGIRSKTDYNPRHFPRFAADRIFPSPFIRGGWNRRPGEDQFLGPVKKSRIKRLPVQNLELYQVQMKTKVSFSTPWGPVKSYFFQKKTILRKMPKSCCQAGQAAAGAAGQSHKA